MNTAQLLELVKNGAPMNLRQRLSLVAKLSVPAMMAQVTSILMQYIDASMVGSLGADASASIGLVASTVWLFGGMCSAVAAGFAVQVAHLVGAKRNDDARSVLRQSLVACLAVSFLLCVISCAIAYPLPRWLGGGEAVERDASRYFLIFAFCLPFLQLSFLGGAMLRCSGNVKVPSMLNVLMCVLDVVFNFIFIFPSRRVGGVMLPGFGLGVTGAALGTALAEAVTALITIYYVYFQSTEIGLKGTHGSYRPTGVIVRKAVKIGAPLALQHSLMCGAQIAITRIVAPLGSVSMAAHSFGITAESLCYMPGIGFSEAATTLVGQCIGARRMKLTRSFANITVATGVVVMGLMGVLIYIGAPLVMAMMSPVQKIVDLGARCLRIEAWAEPLYAAAIVCNGVFIGAGDTTVPSIMNLSSMWLVRISLALIMVSTMGLIGVWTAMCIELCFRGIIFLVRLRYFNWMKPAT